MKISVKIVFFIITTIYFIFLKKIWDLIFDNIIPSIGSVTYVVHLIGLVTLILPISVILTKYLFDLIKKNW